MSASAQPRYVHGVVQTADGQPVRAHILALDASQRVLAVTSTDEWGEYRFVSLARGLGLLATRHEHTVGAGIEDEDVRLLTRHLLGLQKLGLPEFFLDLNADGLVTGEDVLALEQARAAHIRLPVAELCQSDWVFIASCARRAFPQIRTVCENGDCRRECLLGQCLLAEEDRCKRFNYRIADTSGYCADFTGVTFGKFGR